MDINLDEISMSECVLIDKIYFYRPLYLINDERCRENIMLKRRKDLEASVHFFIHFSL
jgi:hypothetical protein